jgi:hypothetical protein
VATVPTFSNPVHPRPCPDPFVLKFSGEYWCYGTGFSLDGRCFPVLHSLDLVNWEDLPGAMAPLAAGYPEYWAPEVTFWNGRFYMYYGCGDGILMQIRVAVSNSPAGPFEDAGIRITPQDFAIDAHVFEDDDGTRYMFYATDFLNHTHIGTGTVIDRMIDPFTLEGNPRPVSRARFDWQVYDPHRLEKGGVRWHTVEGPFVLKRKGRYYQMYSGGNWQNTSYGVSYAATPRIDTLQEWTQLEHDERRPLVLRTLPGEVIGPGHNSVVRGPDNLQMFCVYHRWAADGSGRLLSIDRLEWVGDRILVLGPSTSPQPVPAHPGRGGFSTGWGWRAGVWTTDGKRTRQESCETPGLAVLPVRSGAFVMEATFRLELPETLEDEKPGCMAGIALYREETPLLAFRVAASPQRAEVRRCSADPVLLTTPEDFDAETWHHLRFEVDGDLVKVLLDGLPRWEQAVGGEATDIRIFTECAGASFAGFSVTEGWNDLFMSEDRGPAHGWHVPGVGEAGSASSGWSVRDGALTSDGRGSVLVKRHAFEEYELVVNARVSGDGPMGSVGVIPDLGEDGSGYCFTLESPGGAPRLSVRRFRGIGALAEVEPLQSIPLPEKVDCREFQQLRFHRGGGRVSCRLQSDHVAEVESSRTGRARVALFAYGAPGAFDMVRLNSVCPEEKGA